MVTVKKPSVAGEIDGWCTKCRMDLNHRIVAMIDGQVKRAMCLTCKSEHNYHKPKATTAVAKAVRAKTTRAPRATAGERETAARRAERDRVALWERAIAGQPTTAFRAYGMTESLSEGDLVRHRKFGDGVVTRVIDRQKAEILFQDGPRTMAHST